MNQSTVHALTAIAGLLIGFAFLFTAIKPVHAQEYTFGPTINLSNNTEDSEQSQMAVSGKDVYVAWVDKTAGNGDIFFRASNDNGETFDPIINLSDNRMFSGGPQIATSGNNVYVTWSDDLYGNLDVFFRVSRDKGETFDPTINLSDNPRNSYGHKVAVSDKSVYVAWTDETPENPEIFLRISRDGGQTFGSTINVSKDERVSYLPKIAVSNTNVYLAWQGYMRFDDSDERPDVFFRKSEDGGNTFGDLINVSNSPWHASTPEMIVNNSNIYVAWHELTSGSNEVFLRTSTDDGNSFESSINISDDNSQSISPQMVISDSNVFLVWESLDDVSEGDVSALKSDIFFSASGDGGRTFDEVINLSNNPMPEVEIDDEFLNEVASFPRIVASGKHVYITWINGTFLNSDILFRSSSDAGKTFGPITNLSQSDGISSFPEVDALGSNVYVLWTDEGEILFRTGEVHDSTNGMTIKLHKLFYWADECIHVSGTVGAILEGGPIKIRLLDPENVVRFQAYTLPNQDGTYSLDFILKESGGFGTYIVTATYGLTTVKTSFFVPEVMFGTDPFEPEYFLTNGCVLSYEVKPNSTSLIVSVSTNATDGELSITMPRALIDARTNGNDDDFVVLIDGEKIDFQETNATMISRTLAIPVHASAKEIEIIGTYVIPEFPVNLTIITAVGLIGALIALRVRSRELIIKA